MRTLPLLGCILLGTSPASATDWRYCLATSPDQNTVYMSELFQADMSMSKATDTFSQKLARNHVLHQSVQCPKSADEKSAQAMREYAIRFNQLNGHEVAMVGGNH
jgi:hypothetical protein